MAAAVFLLGDRSASADYVLSLVESPSGATSATRMPGETLALDVLLTSGPGDATDSVGFTVTFSRAGLTLTGFAWASPQFETGGPEDFTSPSIDDLPVTLASEGITFSANTVAFGVTFSGGTLVTIDLAIPASFPDGSDTIAISPDLFLDAESFEPVPTAAGPPFMLTIGDGAPPADGGGNDTDPPVDGGADPGPDTDDDGVSDDLDAFPDDPAETTDTNADGTGDNADPDDDGDGVNDAEDAFPNDPTEMTDTDADGIGDNADPDDDDDGVLDEDDALPLDPGDASDTDADGVGDNAEAPASSGTIPRRGGGFCGAAMLAPFAAMLLSLAAWRRRRVFSRPFSVVSS